MIAVTVEKLSISFDRRLARAIRREAKGEGTSVSEWVSRAAERQLKLAGMGKVLDSWEKEHGAPSKEELAKIDRMLWG